MRVLHTFSPLISTVVPSNTHITSKLEFLFVYLFVEFFLIISFSRAAVFKPSIIVSFTLIYIVRSHCFFFAFLSFAEVLCANHAFRLRSFLFCWHVLLPFPTHLVTSFCLFSIDHALCPVWSRSGSTCITNSSY